MHKWRHTDRYGVEREVYREKIPLPGGKSKYLTAPTRAALRAKIRAWEEEQQELEEQRDGREPLSRYFPRRPKGKNAGALYHLAKKHHLETA